MKRTFAVLLTMFAATVAQAGPLQPGRVTLLCHRTANEDVPENTLESLELQRCWDAMLRLICG